MINKGKIKIIKKVEARSMLPKAKVATSPRKVAREMVSTVTEWVSDLKVRKREETKAAFDLLFGTNSRTSES